MHKYDHTKIEKKWQKDWAKKGLYKTKDKVLGKKNHYLLTEFPYPSGNLHVGHWYAFAVPDIAARALRMQGKNVLYPAGFDAFGLPAENAAIKRGLDPRKWTLQNIAYMKKQMASMGASFDWSREVQTIDPNYYRWTQWMFTQFLKKDLAYRKETPVNWCPKDKTVLANEQVVGGLCERCDSPVEQRTMLQWNLRITDYADRLVDDLDALDWPQQIKDSQKNWIGRSEGAEIDFKIDNTEGSIRVFTTRPDTLFGATYLVLAPEHPMVAQLCANQTCANTTEIEEYVGATKRKSDLDRQENREKTGVKLEGVDAVNPAKEEKIPVYIADYVLPHYGTGAIMAVPAHDERDFEFAQKFGLPIKCVIYPKTVAEMTVDPEYKQKNNALVAEIVAGKRCWSGGGPLIDSRTYTGISWIEAKKAITAAFGTPKKTYRLRDWIVSRQRYWGVPIPVIHCAACGAVPVPDKDLPVKLPAIKDYLPSGDGKSPLAKADKWKKVKCPQCKGWAERETDTLDTFVDSSWYFLRYTDSKNKKVFADKKKMKEWTPVNLYSGGAEHTTMHLLYSRFWHKALYDLKLVNEPEPYTRRMNRGLIMGPDGQKMSKSRGNVIDPDEIVKRLGGDTVRLYLAFIGPFNETGSYPWNPDGVVGVRRFLERVWKLGQPENATGKPAVFKELESSLHKMIKKVTEDVAALKFNTAIAAMMTFINEAERDGISRSQFETLLKLLAPFAPHITEELWRAGGHKKSIHLEKWPKWDEKKMQALTVTIAVQINGKVRGTVSAQPDASQEDVLAIVQGHAPLAKHLENQTIRRVIYVPQRLINIVIG
ncbi:MAG: hypothetical protein RLZZ342_480 [Candidatus Parcubacteria bacterium]|jgi:leucyl-tRNA synthetase